MAILGRECEQKHKARLVPEKLRRATERCVFMAGRGQSKKNMEISY